MADKTLSENGLPLEAQPWARKVEGFIRDELTRRQMVARNGEQAIIAAGTAITTAANSAAAQAAALAEQRRIPARLDVADVAIEATAYFDAAGTPHGRISATVTPSDLDVDGNPLIPVAYQMWGRVFYEDATLEPGDLTTIGFGPNYQLLGTSPTTSIRADALQVGVEYQLRFTAVTAFGVSADLSDWVTATPPATLAEMATPNAPTLLSAAGMLVAQWDGLFGAAQPPSQFRHVYAVVSPTGANAWVRMGSTLARGGGSIQISGLTVGDIYDVGLYGVDSLGVETEMSATSTITIVGVEEAQLSPDLVTLINGAGNAVTFSVDPPEDPGAAIGDTWFQHSESERIIAQWRWDGGGWVPQTISHEVIASIDLGTATVGTLDGVFISARTLAAEALIAGTITVNELSPTIGEELDITANGAVNIIVGRQDDLEAAQGETAASLAQTQARFSFGVDGLEISDPDEPVSLALRAGRLEFLNNGSVVSYLNDGQLFVDSFVGKEVVLGSHKIERRVGTTNETVVRAL